MMSRKIKVMKLSDSGVMMDEECGVQPSHDGMANSPLYRQAEMRALLFWGNSEIIQHGISGRYPIVGVASLGDECRLQINEDDGA